MLRTVEEVPLGTVHGSVNMPLNKKSIYDFLSKVSKVTIQNTVGIEEDNIQKSNPAVVIGGGDSVNSPHSESNVRCSLVVGLPGRISRVVHIDLTSNAQHISRVFPHLTVGLVLESVVGARDSLSRELAALVAQQVENMHVVSATTKRRISHEMMLLELLNEPAPYLFADHYLQAAGGASRGKQLVGLAVGSGGEANSPAPPYTRGRDQRQSLLAQSNSPMVSHEVCHLLPRLLSCPLTVNFLALTTAYLNFLGLTASTYISLIDVGCGPLRFDFTLHRRSRRCTGARNSSSPRNSNDTLKLCQLRQ